MANNKTGFDYYNVDTDRYQDIKIKRLKKSFGTSGIAVYDYILCEIYRVKGCFIAWDESTAFDVADYFGLKETLVNEIVNYCCAVGLFNKALLKSGGIISSRSIQQRFVEMSTRAKRKDFKIPDEINILTEELKIIPEQSPIIPEVSGKGKESKVNNSLPYAQAQEEFPPSNIFDKPLKECYNELASNMSWIEQFVMNIRSAGYKEFTIETFYECLKRFFAKLQNEGEIQKSPKDAMSHFSRWLDIDLKKQEDDKRRAKSFSTTATNSTGEVVRSEAESDTDRKSVGETQKDYSARF